MKYNRLFYMLILLSCVSLLGFGYVLQYVKGLEPCPLCMVQRAAFLLIILVSLSACVHNPGRIGTRIYSGFISLFAVFGAAIAGRQIWLQHLPADKVPECGPGLEFMLEVYPLAETIKTLIKGTGDCAEVVWTFLGLSIPEWSIQVFTLLAVISIYQLYRSRSATFS